MADSRIGDTNYYLVHGWMMNQLGLKGVALQVYAIIYGFSQDGKSEYTGSIQYLCDFCGGVSRPTVIKALKELTEQKYIIRREEIINNVTFVRYKASLPPVKNLYWGSKDFLQGKAKKLPGGSKGTLPNKEIYKEIYKETYKENENERIVPDSSHDSSGNPPAPPRTPAVGKAETVRHMRGKYGWVKLTDDEYVRLLEDYGEEKVAFAIEYVDESAQTTKNKNKWSDWNLVVRKAIREEWGYHRTNTYRRSAGSNTGFHSSNPFMEMLEEERGRR